MKRILITGSNGLLGQQLVDLFTRCGDYNLILTSRQPQSVFAEETLPYIQLDLTQRQKVRNVIEEFEPDVIINTASITDVDKCETDRETAWRTNVTGIENILAAAKLIGSTIIQISTDYVFDGKNGPYDELARPNPLNYYGRTKLAGENLINTSGVPAVIIRSMVLYGLGVGVKPNFGLWLLKNFIDNKPMRIVDDQIGNPTLVADLAYAILRVVERDHTGTYHIAGPDLVSRYDFALAFAETFSFNRKLITPVKTSALKQAAARPHNSGFITLKAETDLGIKMSGIERGLTIFRNEVTSQAKYIAEHGIH
ncbi:MAG: dTDP-4-dehydrorhamnose reductase [Bacteroidota bacterium]